MNLLSTVLGMSPEQGRTRGLKACMVTVDTASSTDCNLVNYYHTFYFFHFLTPVYLDYSGSVPYKRTFSP